MTLLLLGQNTVTLNSFVILDSYLDEGNDVHLFKVIPVAKRGEVIPVAKEEVRLLWETRCT